MSEDKSHKTKKDFFNHHAEKWDEGYSEEELKKASDLIGRCNFIKDETLLEAGCGTGCISKLLADEIREGRIVAIDCSPEMIRKGREKKLPQRIEFICEDVNRVPFDDESFTSVLCFNSFPHFEDREKVMAEFNRLLKPGGRFFIVHSISRQRINEIHHCEGGPIKDDRLPRPEVLHRIISDSGFVKTEVEDGSDFFYLEYVKG